MHSEYFYIRRLLAIFSLIDQASISDVFLQVDQTSSVKNCLER